MTDSVKQSTKERKLLLRAQYMTARKALSAEERASADRAICRHVVSLLSAQRHQGIVALYASFRDEVDVLGLVSDVIQLGWTIAIPKTIVKTRQMRFYEVNPDTEWTSGPYGIREPVVPDTALIPNRSLDVILVPGVAYTLAGHRLGYGGGYYDRLFAEQASATRLGIAYACQIADHLPTEPHDVRVDFVITEAGVRTC